MDESEDKIVIYESYDTVMSANLAKTKLDAYGIPCFLSDEHFVGLYPIRNDVFPGVRLHIFERDQERVKEIVNEKQEVEEEVVRCPHCRSANVNNESEKNGLLKGIVKSLLLGLFIHSKEKYYCKDCKREFQSTPEVPKSSVQ